LLQRDSRDSHPAIVFSVQTASTPETQDPVSHLSQYVCVSQSHTALLEITFFNLCLNIIHIYLALTAPTISCFLPAGYSDHR